MKSKLLSLLGVLALASGAVAQVPPMISYQGRVQVANTNFHGTGQFKFAFVNAAGGVSYWSNDGSSGAGSEPAAAVSLPVNRGLYSTLLGSNMLAIPPGIFANSDVWLRVWFRPGATGAFQLLSPDQRLASAPYAMMAGQVAPNAVGSAQIQNGAITSAKIANGAITSQQLGPISQLSAPDGSPANALAVDNNGRIGLGTGTPFDLLHLSDTDRTTGPNLRLSSTLQDGSGFMGGVLFAINPGETVVNAIRAKEHTPDSYGLEFQTYGGGSLNTKLVVTGNGDIGVGKVNPSAKLDVEGLAKVQNLQIDSRARVSEQTFRAKNEFDQDQMFAWFLTGGAVPGFQSDSLQLWQYPPGGDPACCINHARFWIDNGQSRQDFNGHVGVNGNLNVNGIARFHGSVSFEGPVNLPSATGGNFSGGVAGQNGTFQNINANAANQTGGGIAISDDGGFFDFNDGYVTYKSLCCSQGLKIDAPLTIDGGDAPGSYINSRPRLHIQTSGGEPIFLNPHAGGGPVIVGGNDGPGVLQVQTLIRTAVLEITGGSDVAEPFTVSDSVQPEPGMVMTIDREHPGELCLATSAYDRTVAGIISGANGINPGLTLRQKDTVADGTHPVALSGRVYCWCDASHGVIQPGDLLTTSDTPGHAMAVQDFNRANGAMLGKAMTGLKAGKGLVLVLVSLQ